MSKEQIEYLVWGLIYEAMSQTNCRPEVLNEVGDRLLEIENQHHVDGWYILCLTELAGGTD